MMVMKEEAPALCWRTGNRSSNHNQISLRYEKGWATMRIRHHQRVFNDLPLWTAARARDLKHHNPAVKKLRKRLGISEPVARVIADLSGLGSREGR